MARAFYEDDEVVVTKPGHNEEISKDLKNKESSNGPINFVDGMGVRSTPFIESQMNKFRFFLHDKLSLIEAEFDTQVTAANNEFNFLKSKFNTVVKEPVLPNSIYILTATLTGSILANRRGLTLRTLSPLLFTIGGFKYFMPQSSRHIQNDIIEYEKENYPKFYNQQVEYMNQIKNSQQQLRDQGKQLDVQLLESIHKVRLYIQDIFSTK